MVEPAARHLHTAPTPEPDAIEITVGKTRYILKPTEMTARNAARVREASGMSFRQAAELLSEDPDIDVLAAVCYAAALQVDPAKADYDAIAESLTYSSEIGVGEASLDDEDPET